MRRTERVLRETLIPALERRGVTVRYERAGRYWRITVATPVFYCFYVLSLRDVEEACRAMLDVSVPLTGGES